MFKRKAAKPLLSAAFCEFVQHLTVEEAERLTERRLTSPQATRNESVQDFILNRSSKI